MRYNPNRSYWQNMRDLARLNSGCVELVVEYDDDDEHEDPMDEHLRSHGIYGDCADCLND